MTVEIPLTRQMPGKTRSAKAVIPGIIAVTIFFMVLLMPLMSVAQGGPVGPGEDKTIDARMQKEIIDSISGALNTTYVFPDVARKMEEHLRKQLKDGRYKELAGCDAFCRKLSEDLQSVSKDGHLYVMFVSDEYIAQMANDTLTDSAKAVELAESKRDNFGFKEVKILNGNIGYLDFRQFSDAKNAGATAIAAMNFLGNTDAIIIDLRQNGGGFPSMIQLLSSYFFEEPVHLNSFYIRASDSTEQYWSYAYVPGTRLPKADLYVLTSSYTFSGAEEFTYNMKNLKRGTIIGETTGGGAHPVNRKVFKNLNVGVQLPYGRAINPISGTNWEGTGVTPDIAVPSDKALNVAHLEALKKLAQKADSPDRKRELEWAMEGLETIVNPVSLPEDSLKLYVGDFGPRHVTIENGRLYYQREKNPRFALIPMGSDKFMAEGLDYFRIKFVRDSSGKVIELIGMYDNGRTDSNPKNP